MFDTVIFVRCLLNPYSIWGRLVREHRTRYHLVLSEPVLAEIVEVIQRPEVHGKFRFVSTFSPRDLLALLADAEVVTLGAIPAASRDPKDNKFLATATAAGAAYLVSEDRDLLDLESYQGTRILTAAAFLAALE